MTRTNLFRLTLLLAAATATGACLDDSITGTRPLSIQIIASTTTPAVGAAVDFEFLAQGRGLSLVVLNYGDGGVDSVTFSGPVEAGGDLVHTYTVAGMFTVVGEATGIEGITADSLTITVN